MINITILDDGIITTGHSNFAEDGKDIICASVSALMQTLELCGNSLKRKGYMRVETKDKYGMFLIANGLKLIAEAYPKYVEIKGCKATCKALEEAMDKDIESRKKKPQS